MGKTVDGGALWGITLSGTMLLHFIELLLSQITLILAKK